WPRNDTARSVARHVRHPPAIDPRPAGVRADTRVLRTAPGARPLCGKLPADYRLHVVDRRQRHLEVGADQVPVPRWHVSHLRDRLQRHHAKGAAGSGLRLLGIRMEALGLLLQGFQVLLTFKILALMMVGLVLGIFVGVLPGLGGPNGVAILLPLTFTMDPTSAIVMLSCLYWGALFGGAITSILFNI